MSNVPQATSAWPSLPLPDWQETYANVHRWTQMIGKTRLALSPPQNHWWHAALYVTARGLTTSAMPYDARSLDVELDFVDHRLIARASDGAVGDIPLTARPVADLYGDYEELLRALGFDVRIWPMPVEIAGAVRFTDDRIHHGYDPEAVQRCWRILLRVQAVLQRFRSDFLGKCSPVHFWWGAFDLACTRFSGRTAPPHPGGVPDLPDDVAREAYSHECTSSGWWPGTIAGPLREPAFYSYAYPEPAGYPKATVRPSAAYYHEVLREWVLPYDAVRTAADPDAVLLEFLDTTYAAAANLAGWDRAALERAPAGPTKH